MSLKIRRQIVTYGAELQTPTNKTGMTIKWSEKYMNQHKQVVIGEEKVIKKFIKYSYLQIL